MDISDKKLLRILQLSADLSNSAIGDTIGLSASQVSRRRQKLEEAGIIEGYRAVLSHSALGYTLDAIIRVKLGSHDEKSAEQFRSFVEDTSEIRFACAITGDADYLLHARLKDLAALSSLINKRLLPHPLVAEVRSEVVLDLIKDDGELAIS